MQVSLATPDKIIFTAEAAENVQLKADNGDIEILPRHTNYIALVSPGPVSVRIGQGEQKKFQVGEGVVKVEDDRVSILCKAATLL